MNEKRSYNTVSGQGKSESSAGADWSFFPFRHCISLIHREDRREAARRQFDSVGLSPVGFHLAVKHPTDPEQGIYESHMACLEKGLAADAPVIVVFEDDILFHRFRPEVLADAVDFLRSRNDWDVFFFGCMVKSSRPTAHAHVRAVRYRCSAHAYAVTADLARRLTALPWQGVAFDDQVRDMPGLRTFAASPCFAFQSEAASDNDRWASLDRLRRWCGGFRRIQRCNEFFHQYRTVLVALHVAAVAGLALIFL